MKKVFAIIALFVAISYSSFAANPNPQANAAVSVSVVHTTPSIALATGFINAALTVTPGSFVLLPAANFNIWGGDPGCTCTVTPSGWIPGNPSALTVTAGNTATALSLVADDGTLAIPVTETFNGASLAAASGAATETNTWTLTVVLSNY
jgi:hypothetical protein